MRLALAVVVAVAAADSARGQYAAQQTAPMGQPMWISPTPMFQVGPDGAVNVDQPMMAPAAPYGGNPMMMPGMQPMACETCDPSGCQPCPQGCPPYAAPMMYMAPQACQPVVVQPPLPPPVRWTVFGEAMWIHPTGVDMAHAQQQNGIGGAGTVPFGEIGVLDPSYDIGFRVGGEVEFTPCSAVFVQYGFYENTTTSSLEAPDIPGGGGAVGSFVQHPGAAITASAGPVDAMYDIEFQIADAAYRQILVRDQLRKISVFAGGRFAQLDQFFVQEGVFSGGQFGVIDTSSMIEFSGGGPMAGIDADRRIGAGNFSVYGRALVAAITGVFENHYRMENRTTDTLLAESTWDDDRIVPMLDYELGLAWTDPQGHLRLSIGYMASHWFNVVTTPELIDAVQDDNYVDLGDTISFDGAVGRVQWTF
jgi:hypothetical protein